MPAESSNESCFDAGMEKKSWEGTNGANTLCSSGILLSVILLLTLLVWKSKPQWLCLANRYFGAGISQQSRGVYRSLHSTFNRERFRSVTEAAHRHTRIVQQLFAFNQSILRLFADNLLHSQLNVLSIKNRSRYLDDIEVCGVAALYYIHKIFASPHSLCRFGL